tara:strand:+ start:569 stop:781 length:213 start_codon:yes stop_codon:yes gene_type:complete
VAAQSLIGIGLATVCPWPTPNVAPPGTPLGCLPQAQKPRSVTPAGAFGVLGFIYHYYFIKELHHDLSRTD